MKKFFKAFFKALLYFLVYFGVQVVTGAVIGIALVVYTVISGDMSISEESLINKFESYSNLLILVSNLLSLLIIWLFFIIRKKKITKETQICKCNVKQAVAAVMFGIGISFLIGAVTEMIPFPESMVESFESSHDQLGVGSPVINFISVAIIAPVTEELFLRGLVYTRLKRGMPTAVAMVVSSLMFGVLHGEIIWIISATAAGLALVWVFENTKTLVCPIIVHVVNNAIAQITLALPEVTLPWVNILINAVSTVLFVSAVIIFVKSKPQQHPVTIE